jgi:hypothetical protein
MSSTDVMQTSTDVKRYRQRHFPNWQKRGKKIKKEVMSGGDTDDDDSPKKKQKTAEVKTERKSAIDEDSDVDVVAYDSLEEVNAQWSLRSSSSVAASSVPSVPAHPPTSVSPGVPASR